MLLPLECLVIMKLVVALHYDVLEQGLPPVVKLWGNYRRLLTLDTSSFGRLHFQLQLRTQATKVEVLPAATCCCMIITAKQHLLVDLSTNSLCQQ